MDLSTTQSLRHSQGINWSQKIRVLQYQSGAQAEEDWLPLERGAYQQTTLANLENYAERPQQNQDL